MSQPTPPQIEVALNDLRKALHAAEAREIDPLSAPWSEIERGVIKLLGGAFNPQSDGHRAVGFMIAAALAERLRRDLDAFWFPNRASPQGAALGFPAGVIVFSPFGAAMEALRRARLPMLDDMTAELRKVIDQARAQDPAGAQALGPEDYQRLFDPGFMQFTTLRAGATRTLWERSPEEERRELEDAFGRLPKQVPREAREPMRRQLTEALGQLAAQKPLGEQVATIPQLGELLALLHGAAGGTGFAPVELWEEILLPLLHIGAPESFPPLDDQEVAAYRAGAEPLFVYVEANPFQSPAADEDGALGVFPPEDLGPIDECFDGAEGLRLVRVEPTALRALAERFNGAAVRSAVERFTDHLRAAAGETTPATPRNSGGPSLLDAALVLLEDLVRLVRSIGDDGDLFLCVRNATESEASAEPLVQELRRVLTGPRIIIPGA
jgi:hypothetical protein